MNETVEVIGGQNETVALRNDSPTAEKNISGQTALQRSGQVFVEDGVQVIVIGARISVEVSRESSVGVVDAFGVVVALPELDRPDVGGDEDGRTQDRVERGRKDGGNGSL